MPRFSAASLWEITIKCSLGREDLRANTRLLRRGLLDNGYTRTAHHQGTRHQRRPPAVKDGGKVDHRGGTKVDQGCRGLAGRMGGCSGGLRRLKSGALGHSERHHPPRGVFTRYMGGWSGVCASVLALLQAIALAVHFQNVDTVSETVQQGATRGVNYSCHLMDVDYS